jgi:hypothetical protein
VSSEQSIGRQEREEAKGASAQSRPEAVWPVCGRPPRSHPSISPPHNRLLIALLSGALATAVNMTILATLGAARIRTTHGGLLRLLALGVIRVAHSAGINPTYPTEPQLLFAAAWFQEGFHIVTGLLMAVVYVFCLEPRCGPSPLLRGVLYGSTIWLLNALIVLPAIGEGIAGQYHLSAAGIGGFAVAHMSYFLTLSLLTSSLRPITLETGGQLN